MAVSIDLICIHLLRAQLLWCSTRHFCAHNVGVQSCSITHAWQAALSHITHDAFRLAQGGDGVSPESLSPKGRHPWVIAVICDVTGVSWLGVETLLQWEQWSASYTAAAASTRQRLSIYRPSLTVSLWLLLTHILHALIFGNSIGLSWYNLTPFAFTAESKGTSGLCRNIQEE